MGDTTEENTRWVETWAVNASDYYGELLDAANDGPDALREYVYKLWSNATEDGDNSGTWYQAREMSESDYDAVNWSEVAATLLGEG